MPVYAPDRYGTMCTRLRIEADSVEEAEKNAHAADLSPGEHVPDNFETDPQALEMPPEDDSSI